MKIIYMGTPEIASKILTDLVQSEHEILAVVTQPDRPKGRGGKLAISPVKEVALEHNIPVLQPTKLREEGVYETLKAYHADAIVVAAFGQILPQNILDLTKFGCINVHASLLPKYRGAAPIQWSIIDGEEKTGVTIMYMDAGIDTGDIIMKEELILDKKENAGTLHDKLAAIGGPLLLKALHDIENGIINREKQDDSQANYVKIISKEFGHIDFSKSAVAIERLIRGLNPWPSAYASMEGKTVKIWDAEVIDKEYDGVVGQVVEIAKDGIYIKTGVGTISITELQLEGKKRMTTDAFLRGYKLELGIVLE